MAIPPEARAEARLAARGFAMRIDDKDAWAICDEIADEVLDAALVVAEAPYRELLTEAERLLTHLWKNLLSVKPWLDKPYPDVPEQSPWTNGIEARARAAHDLSMKIRKHIALERT